MRHIEEESLSGLMLLSTLFFDPSMASNRKIGKLSLGFQASPMSYIDHLGLFLVSNNSNFGFGFISTSVVTSYMLVILHTSSTKVIWTANRGSPVGASDTFVFDLTGNAYLQKGGRVVWGTDSGSKGVSALELLDSGNLVLWGNNGVKVWQSFDHPTDTLISNQVFVDGMKLVSDTGSGNLSYTLEMKSGDMTLSANYTPPQPYWSMGRDTRRTVDSNGGGIVSASFTANSWRFFDKNSVLLSQFQYSDDNDANATWIAVLGNNGFITFYILNDAAASSSPTKIPADSCSTPQPCGTYYICTETRCQCPSALSSNICGSGISSSCGKQQNSVSLVNAGDGLEYFALSFVTPFSKTDLNGCKASCISNCSCLAMFFEYSSGNCFVFNQIGSFQSSGRDSRFASFVKVSNNGGKGIATNGGKKRNGFHYAVIIIVLGTVFIISGILFGTYRYYRIRYKKRKPGFPEESSEDDGFLENLAGMPTRFSFKDLQTATNDFSVKLGQGGFGSVYSGVLLDGTRIAVKKLEGIGQGTKEFRAEVSIIGSIHHHHLVKLKGFCAEGAHRLLAYEFMANGSLDKWIFRRKDEDSSSFLLPWETRFSIALGTAKGLAYLHEDCDQKIIHCDIKPENVLLDDRFLAKVSDFGLAKLMTREQSHVFTTLRGTRGYLAPEWLTNYAISEKSDVYSYGMLLLEIVAGRKNFDPDETSEKSHFPSYAFKMCEEGKLREILDSRLITDDKVKTAIEVALWCINEDMSMRPSMGKVVKMLEGISPVPNPPVSSPLGFRLSPGFLDCSSDDSSTARLSGPR